MKLDMNLFRAILLQLEARDELSSVDSSSLEVSGQTQDAITYHAQLLIDAGLIVGREESPIGRRNICIERMTWEGHQFLATAGKQLVWETAQKRFKELGGRMSFELLKQVLSELAKQAIGGLS